MGLLSLGAKMLIHGAKGAYDSNKGAQQRRAALQYGMNLITTYSSIYRTDPRGERGLAQLPIEADDLHKDIYCIYYSKVARARGDVEVAINGFRQLITGYIDILPATQRKQVASSIDADHHRLKPEIIVECYDRIVDWLFDHMFPGQSRHWLLPQSTPIARPAPSTSLKQSYNQGGRPTYQGQRQPPVAFERSPLPIPVEPEALEVMPDQNTEDKRSEPPGEWKIWAGLTAGASAGTYIGWNIAHDLGQAALVWSLAHKPGDTNLNDFYYTAPVIGAVIGGIVLGMIGLGIGYSAYKDWMRR